MSMWLWRDGLVGVLTVALAVAFFALIGVGPARIGWGATWAVFALLMAAGTLICGLVLKRRKDSGSPSH